MKSKYLIILIIHIFSISCFSQKLEKEKLVLIDIKEKAELLTDSLKISNIDTMLFIYMGCSGCVSGIYKSGYVFWKKNNLYYVKKIDNNGVYNEVYSSADIFSYFFKNYKSILNDSLVAPQYSLMSGKFINIKLWFNGEIYEKKVFEYYRHNENIDKKLIIWICYIESVLFNIERTSMYWIR